MELIPELSYANHEWEKIEDAFHFHTATTIPLDSVVPLRHNRSTTMLVERMLGQSLQHHCQLFPLIGTFHHSFWVAGNVVQFHGWRLWMVRRVWFHKLWNSSVPWYILHKEMEIRWKCLLKYSMKCHDRHYIHLHISTNYFQHLVTDTTTLFKMLVDRACFLVYHSFYPIVENGQSKVEALVNYIVATSLTVQHRLTQWGKYDYLCKRWRF